MKKKIKRSWVIMLTGVFCMSIFAGCSKDKKDYEPVGDEPELYEDEYYEDEYYEDGYYEDEGYIEDETVEETQKTSSQGAEFAVGKWYTEGYDEEENWAASYVIELKEDGTATCVGYRNKDAGTYEATGMDSVLITFDNCEVDEVGEGFKPVDGFKYTIDMKIKGDNATIRIDAPDVISNLEDGTVHRNAGKSEDGASPVGKWYTEGYDTDENWAGSYVIELKEDGTATCEGYRNRDAGKYEVKGDGEVEITFDFCETDEVGAGWVAAEGYSYTVDMTIDGDEAKIKVNASGSDSNLEDGTLHREKDADAAKAGMSRSSNSKAKKGRKISFTTSDFEGKKITSEEIFSKHEVTMVNIWATWCYWCIDEMPQLDKLNKSLEKKDCAIVGLLGDVEEPGTLEDAKEILEENGVTYLNILPWDGALEEDFRMGDAWPTSFFVDREGYIVGEPVVGAETDLYEKKIDEILSGR